MTSKLVPVVQDAPDSVLPAQLPMAAPVGSVGAAHGSGVHV